MVKRIIALMFLPLTVAARSATKARRAISHGFLVVAVIIATPALGQQPEAIQPEQIAPDLGDFADELPPLQPLVDSSPEPPPEPIVSEAELNAPLAPIGSVEPPPAVAATADTNLPDVRYDVEITGLREIGLETRFRDLSALLDKGRSAGNATQVSERANVDVGLAESLLRSKGYFDAVASAQVGPLPGKDGRLRVALTVTPGPRYALSTMTLTGMGDTMLAPEPRAIVTKALDLHSGAPIVAPVIEAAEANAALRLPESGYPFAEVGQRDILLDDVSHLGDYTLPVAAGRKARFGGFRVAGDDVFKVGHISILPRFKPGEIYDSRRVDDLRKALAATSLFSTVAVEPVATGNIDADGIETVDLLVSQTRGLARNLAANAGYGTGEGLKISGAWTQRNLFPPEGALIVAAVAGTNEQSLRAQFIRSNAGQRDRALQAGTSVSRQRYDAYSADTINLNASLARASTPLWQKRWTWSLGGELLASREAGADPTNVARDTGTYLIAALPTQLGYDRSDSLLDPTRGFRLNGRISPEVQKKGSDGVESYGRFLFEASAYYPVSGALVLAGRARLGSIIGAPRDDIAPSRRLYAGGGGSVRGFGYQELGPRGGDGKPLGGRSLTEFAFEVRYRFGDFGIVPFIDAGRVGEASAPSLSGMRYGAGIGGRYYTSFGPMRIDVATPIARRPGEARVTLYISIGQAF